MRESRMAGDQVLPGWRKPDGGHAGINKRELLDGKPGCPFSAKVTAAPNQSKLSGIFRKESVKEVFLEREELFF